MGCCNTDAYDQTFNMKRARKQLKQYLHKGAQRTTIPLVKILRELPLKGKSVLDVGGGMGTIVFETLDRGAVQVQMVEQSRPYLQVFREEVDRRGLSAQVTPHYGDFVQIADEIAKADLVVLDKVICCYPDYQQQIKCVMRKAENWIAYSLPVDVWWVRWRNDLFNIWKKCIGKEFRTFVHPTSNLEALVVENGFTKSVDLRRGSWQYVLFERQL